MWTLQCDFSSTKCCCVIFKTVADKELARLTVSQKLYFWCCCILLELLSCDDYGVLFSSLVVVNRFCVKIMKRVYSVCDYKSHHWWLSSVKLTSVTKFSCFIRYQLLTALCAVLFNQTLSKQRLTHHENCFKVQLSQPLISAAKNILIFETIHIDNQQQCVFIALCFTL